MTTSPITSGLNATAAAPSTTSSSSSTSNAGQADENEFLQLLVTQMQNQDPLNPQDSTEFVAQLAQFSSLEQLININQNISILTGQGTASTGAAAAASSSTTNAITNASLQE